jgi:hypothetical protein
MMPKDKFCELKGGIFLMKGRKLLYKVHMNVRCTILSICPIQSLIPSWLRLGGIRKACMFKNENCHYF